MPDPNEYVVEILFDLGLISRDDIQKAEEHAKTEGVGLVDALIAMGRITHMDVSKALASQFGIGDEVAINFLKEQATKPSKDKPTRG